MKILIGVLVHFPKILRVITFPNWKIVSLKTTVLSIRKHRGIKFLISRKFGGQCSKELKSKGIKDPLRTESDPLRAPGFYCCSLPCFKAMSVAGDCLSTFFANGARPTQENFFCWVCLLRGHTDGG